MGKIKVLKNEDLVGEQGANNIYPVTSTRAVYSADNVTQESINNSIYSDIASSRDSITKNAVDIQELRDTISNTINTIDSIDGHLKDIEDDLAAVGREVKNDEVISIEEVSSHKFKPNSLVILGPPVSTYDPLEINLPTSVEGGETIEVVNLSNHSYFYKNNGALYKTDHGSVMKFYRFNGSWYGIKLNS